MEDKKHFIINWLYYAMIVVLFLIGSWFILKYCLVIVISFIVFLFLDPIVKWFIELLKIRNKILINIIKIFISLMILMIIIILSIVIIYGIAIVLNDISNYGKETYLSITNNKQMMVIVMKIYNYFQTSIHHLLNSLVNVIMSIIINLANVIFQIGFGIFLVLFLIIDDEWVFDILNQMKLTKKYIMPVVLEIKFVVSQFIKSYTIIAIIVFWILFLSFRLLAINHYFVLAIMISFIDFLPVFGLDMIFVPWIIILALLKDFVLAMELLVIYGLIIIIKNILEPHLLSTSLSLKPIIMLIIMYLGGKIYGMIGMIIFPIVYYLTIKILKVGVNNE